MHKHAAIGTGAPLIASTGHLLTWTEAAAVIGLSTRTLRRLNAAGTFPEPVVITGLRGRRFRREDIARWLDAAGERPAQGG